MADIPSPAQVEGFFNTTKSYDVNTITSAVSDTMYSLSGIKEKIYTLSKGLNNKEENQENQEKQEPKKFQSKDEMIKIVMDFFRATDTRMAERIQAVLNDGTIDKRIELIDSGKSTGKATPQGNGLLLEIHATKDANGIIAIAQELTNAYVYQIYLAKQREDANKRKEFVAKAAKKFIASLIIRYLAKNSMLTIEQTDRLQNDSFRELTDSIESLESSVIDQPIFEQMCQDNPDAFENSLANYSEDNFKRSMAKLGEKGLSSEMVTSRIKAVAEQGKTPIYLMGDVISQFSAYKLQDMFNHNHEQAMTDLLNGIEAGETLSTITGMSNAELIEEAANSTMLQEVVENARDESQEDMSDDTASEELVLEMERRNLNNK